MELFKNRMAMAVILAVLAATFGFHSYRARKARHSLRATAANAVEPEKWDAFLRAVRTDDFAGMQGLGDEIFTEGRKVPEARRKLAEFQVAAAQPASYAVYRLHAKDEPGKTRRVLLTVDDKSDRVVSFIAEEMAVAE